MESHVNYTVVGAFVIGLTAALIVILLWLSVGLTEKNYHYYLAYMHESVAGLSEDAPVKYNGVNIGSVKKISLDPESLKEVRLLLAIEEDIPIKADTVASLISQGLTGISYINLSGGNKLSPLLTTKPGEEYPIIKTEPSLYFKLDNAVREVSQSLVVVSKDLHDILSQKNQAALKNTLANLEVITNNLAANSQQFNATIKQVGTAANAMKNMSADLGDAATNASTFMRNGNALTTELEQNPSILIRGRQATALGPGE